MKQLNVKKKENERNELNVNEMFPFLKERVIQRLIVENLKKFFLSVCPIQSDFSNMENRSEEVFRHGDFAQWGFKHRGIQRIRFQGSIQISQSGLTAP